LCGFQLDFELGFPPNPTSLSSTLSLVIIVEGIAHFRCSCVYGIGRLEGKFGWEIVLERDCFLGPLTPTLNLLHFLLFDYYNYIVEQKTPTHYIT